MLFLDIPSLIETYNSKNPNQVALITGNKKLSYSELFKSAQALAALLQAANLQNERIALFLPNSMELVIAYLGCFLAGAIAVPLNVALKQPEIKYIIEMTTPKWLLTNNDKHLELAPVLQEKTSLQKTVIINHEFLSEQATFDYNPTKIAVSAPAVIFYTSGSTGKPKGVTHSQKSLIAMMDNMADCVDLTANDRFLVSEPMSNASGCIHAFLTLYKNATAIIISSFNIEEFKQATQHQPTVMSVMGKGNYDIVNDETLTKQHYASIRFNFSGGDKITKDLMRAFKEKTGIPIRLGYGMSEFLLIAINKSETEDKLTSVGKATKNITLKLLNTQGQSVAAEEMGEVWVNGPNCMLGYWKNDELTNETIIKGWLRTGDLAKCDRDGYLWIMGRIKQMIIRGGDNISPLEIEDILASHPAVNAAGVIGISDPEEGEVPKAFVELKAGYSATESELLAFIKKEVEDYKVPVAVIIVKALPRTKNGKIAREELKKM